MPLNFVYFFFVFIYYVLKVIYRPDGPSVKVMLIVVNILYENVYALVIINT